jgi:hypothetical protein
MTQNEIITAANAIAARHMIRNQRAEAFAFGRAVKDRMRNERYASA